LPSPAKGCGRVNAAKRAAGRPAELNSAALYAHFRSRQSASFADKLMPAMRNSFGEHLEPKAER